jgi:hypothetical protein
MGVSYLKKIVTTQPPSCQPSFSERRNPFQITTPTISPAGCRRSLQKVNRMGDAHLSGIRVVGFTDCASIPGQKKKEQKFH